MALLLRSAMPLLRSIGSRITPILGRTIGSGARFVGRNILRPAFDKIVQTIKEIPKIAEDAIKAHILQKAVEGTQDVGKKVKNALDRAIEDNRIKTNEPNNPQTFDGDTMEVDTEMDDEDRDNLEGTTPVIQTIPTLEKNIMSGPFNMPHVLTGKKRKRNQLERDLLTNFN